MSVEALMTCVVTLRKQSGETQSDTGEATLTYTSLATTMYLEPSHGGGGSSFIAGREDMANRNTPIGDWFGIGRVADDFGSWDQIVYGEHVFDIIAPPRPFGNPRTQVTSHVELSLQEVL